MEFGLNRVIQLHELRTRIRRKVCGSTRERVSRLQCRYLTSVNPYRYELFNVKSKLDVVISSHCSSRNIVMELYVKFPEDDGSGPSSATVAANVGTSTKVESPTTRLCNGFTGLLQISYHDVLETSMGYRRTDDLLLSIKSSNGTSNPFVKGDNKGVNEEEDEAKEEERMDAIDG
ncbi:hypothetical protein J1N35_007100 [Gossypium stocksii]|uniref:Uncharacterized protein n=1 Tax=Gossypium stocksii TaxID=47602 RepID=A0A9D3W6D8_9ROSI|nr:hypothetical protein J1N35_007100 [Gossypium stocksii]